MKEIRLSSTRNTEIINVTGGIAAAVANSGVKEGICVVYTPNTTAAILKMEADGAVEKDVLRSLLHLVPKMRVISG